MDTIAERRRFKRYDCSFRVCYDTTDRIATIGSFTISKNISKGGVRLLVSRLIKKGNILKLRIFHEDINNAVEVFGKVRWICSEPADTNLIVDAGVQFTATDPSEVDQLLASVK